MLKLNTKKECKPSNRPSVTQQLKGVLHNKTNYYSRGNEYIYDAMFHLYCKSQLLRQTFVCDTLWFYPQQLEHGKNRAEGIDYKIFSAQNLNDTFIKHQAHYNDYILI